MPRRLRRLLARVLWRLVTPESAAIDGAVDREATTVSFSWNNRDTSDTLPVAVMRIKSPSTGERWIVMSPEQLELLANIVGDVTAALRVEFGYDHAPAYDARRIHLH